MFSVNDILCFIDKKLPLTIYELRKCVSSVQSSEELISILEQYAQRKTALNIKQIVKLSIYAYKYLQ